MADIPAILEHGKTAVEWKKIFADRGIEISDRTLAEHARKLGACHRLGNALIIMPEHIDRIFQEAEQCPSNSTPGKATGGLKDESKDYRPVDTTDKAFAHLANCQKPTPKKGSRRSKPRKSNVITLATGQA